MLRPSRAIVTGAGGFIGSAVVRALERAEAPFVAVYRRAQLLTSPSGVQRDLARDDLKDIVAPGDVVIHLAARIPSAFEGPDAEASARENVALDHRVLHWCAERGAHLVYASSVAVYGLGRWQGVRSEHDPADPRGPYARAKLDSERAVVDLLRERAVVLRVSSPYGPGQPVRTVLRLFLERAAADLPLLLHGSGERRQDFVDVRDVADAFVRAAERRASGIVNVATGKPVSMRQLAEAVLAAMPMSQSVIRQSGESDPQEGFTARYAIERARLLIGWVARTRLSDGLERCVSDTGRQHHQRPTS